MHAVRSTLLFLSLTLLLVFLIPPSWSIRMQSLVSRSHSTIPVKKTGSKGGEDALKIENERLMQLLAQCLASDVKEAHQRALEAMDDDSSQRRMDDLIQRYSLLSKRVIAPVVQRDYSSWSSHLWIGVGHKTNKTLKEDVIAIDSPVVCNHCIVGVVERVEENRSLIRLLTSPKLSISVRVARGIDEDVFLLQKLQSILHYMRLNQKLKKLPQIDELIGSLEALKQSLLGKGEVSLLAKGELHGHAEARGRKLSSLLVGEGFNYDYADEEGPARELKTGSLLDHPSHAATTPLLQVGDLLVSTGMDGVFPPGFFAAYVQKIEPMEEGDSSFRLEAKAGIDFQEIDFVEVLPPWFPSRVD